MEFKPDDRVWVYYVSGNAPQMEWKDDTVPADLLNPTDGAITYHLVQYAALGCAVLVIGCDEGFGFEVVSSLAVRTPYTHDLGEVKVSGLPPAIAFDGEPMEYMPLDALGMMQAGKHPKAVATSVVNETDTQLVMQVTGIEPETYIVFQKADKEGDQ